MKNLFYVSICICSISMFPLYGVGEENEKKLSELTATVANLTNQLSTERAERQKLQTQVTQSTGEICNAIRVLMGANYLKGIFNVAGQRFDGCNH